MAISAGTKFSRSTLALLLGSMIAGCSYPIPNASDLLEECEGFQPNKPAEATLSAYFVSSALPRCKDGEARLTVYRNLPEQFGRGHYRPDDDVKKLDPVVELEPQAADWFNDLEQHAAAAGGKLTVFIHGYNNSFTEAFRRGANIASIYPIPDEESDKSQVPVVVLHWPSRASLTRYTFDEASINWAQHAIEQRLAELTTIASDITLIAHSMGTRAAVRSVLALDRIEKANVPGKAEAQTVKPDSVKRIVLASGDIDRDAVLRKGGSVDLMIKDKPWLNEQSSDAPREASSEPRRNVLIYASFRDTPIQASRTLHGYDRLGSTSCRYDISYDRRKDGTLGNCHRTTDRPGLTVVSTSSVDGPDRLNHADFLDDCTTRAHLSAFLLGEKVPNAKMREYVKVLDPVPSSDGLGTPLTGFEIYAGKVPKC